MSTGQSFAYFVTRHSNVAVVVYGVLVAVFIFAGGNAIIDLYDRYAKLAASTVLLDQLDGRASSPRAGPSTEGAQVPSGSPFLEGHTVTVAGAVLLQRVISAVTRVGGQVLSSQVDLQGALAKQDYVSVIANCEVDQPALQRLLYDIESGMPYLFIDQLVVQSPEESTQNGGRMRVLVGISGQWRGNR